MTHSFTGARSAIYQPPIQSARSGILSDGSIIEAVRTGLIGIEPFSERHVQPCSYDLTVRLGAPLTLLPGVFHLITTRERVRLPATIQGQVHGRSSIGRLGVLVHFTAGFVDPGFPGELTLEVMALHKPVTIEDGDRLAQIAFTWLDQPCLNPYRGRYQNQSGATPSKFEHGDL